jgi:ubiquitin carboxyl-terminal hydrolase 34
MQKSSLELAPYESKTKESYAWKSELKVGDLVDAYDKTIWNKSTILDIADTNVNDKVIRQAMIAYRIYVEKGQREDEKGKYEGYSNKYDELVNLYSPRIQPFFTKSARSSYYDDYTDIDDDFDVQFPCEEGHTKVYAVPRIRKCTSRLFTHLMNQFGHMGGFELIASVIKRICANCQTQEELNAVCTLIEMVSKPYLIYHKEFLKDYFPSMINLAKLCIRNAPDRFIRDINRDKVEVIVRSIDNMHKRTSTKEERDKETEVLKLEMALSCLKSSFLERRIQGIKDLNQLIRNNRVMSSKTISNAFLV